MDESVSPGSSPARLIAFSDGVAAIAITLLILPLVDIQIPPGNAYADSHPLQYVWQTYNGLITSFLISWLVIISFWLAHHRIFARLEAMNPAIVVWNIVWLFAIVVFPFPTSLLSQGQIDHPGQGPIATLYVANMFLISLSLAMLSRQLRQHPELLTPAAREVGGRNRTTEAMMAYMGLLLVVSFWFPQQALWGLMGLWVVIPLAGYFAGRSSAVSERDPRTKTG